MAGSATITGKQNYVMGIGHPASEPLTEGSPAIWNTDGTALTNPVTGADVTLGGGLTTGRSVTASTTLALNDAGTIIYSNSGSGCIFTISQDSTISWPVDTVIGLYQQGAGINSFAAGSGVTLRSPAGIAASVQYAHIYARKVATNEWALV
jgi:hypothetical protein